MKGLSRALTPQEVGLILGVVALVLCGCLGCVAASLVPPSYPAPAPAPTATFSTTGEGVR